MPAPWRLETRISKHHPWVRTQRPFFQLSAAIAAARKLYGADHLWRVRAHLEA